MLKGIIQATYVQAPLTSLSKSNSTGSDKVSQPFIPSVKFDIKYLIPASPYYFYKGIFGFQNSLGGCGNESNILVYSGSLTFLIFSIFISTAMPCLMSSFTL